MPFHPVAHLWQLFLGVLQKMKRGAVGFERGIVPVLLVDEEAAWFGLMAVYLVGDAAGLFAGLFGQLGKNSGHLTFAANFRHPRHSQDNHRSLRWSDCC